MASTDSTQRGPPRGRRRSGSTVRSPGWGIRNGGAGGLGGWLAGAVEHRPPHPRSPWARRPARVRGAVLVHPGRLAGGHRQGLTRGAILPAVLAPRSSGSWIRPRHPSCGWAVPTVPMAQLLLFPGSGVRAHKLRGVHARAPSKSRAPTGCPVPLALAGENHVSVGSETGPRGERPCRRDNLDRQPPQGKVCGHRRQPPVPPAGDHRLRGTHRPEPIGDRADDPSTGPRVHHRRDARGSSARSRAASSRARRGDHSAATEQPRDTREGSPPRASSATSLREVPDRCEVECPTPLGRRPAVPTPGRRSTIAWRDERRADGLRCGPGERPEDALIHGHHTAVPGGGPASRPRRTAVYSVCV